MRRKRAKIQRHKPSAPAEPLAAIRNRLGSDADPCTVAGALFDRYLLSLKSPIMAPSEDDMVVRIRQWSDANVKNFEMYWGSLALIPRAHAYRHGLIEKNYMDLARVYEERPELRRLAVVTQHYQKLEHLYYQLTQGAAGEQPLVPHQVWQDYVRETVPAPQNKPRRAHRPSS